MRGHLINAILFGKNRCSISRAQTRQSTLWGMWGNNNNDSRGESSRDGEAEEDEAQRSWRGPSKDKKGHG